MPNAVVVPISINNSWKTLRYGKFPMGLGAHITFKVHKPLRVDEHEQNALVKQIEQTIIKDIYYDA
jgi:1-acyl-sn-glycerol-3-phosphate acyltransferase